VRDDLLAAGEAAMRGAAVPIGALLARWVWRISGEA